MAIAYIPRQGGRLGAHLQRSPTRTSRPRRRDTGALLTGNNQLQYATLAFGSACGDLPLPARHHRRAHHQEQGRGKRSLVRAARCTASSSASSRCSGCVAHRGHIKPLIESAGKAGHKHRGARLFEGHVPVRVRRRGFAMIIIGALVPAAVMSIAAANLFTRNIYKEYLRRDAIRRRAGDDQPRSVSLVVKVGALLFILLLQPQFSIDLQLHRRGDHPADAARGVHRPVHPVAAPGALLAGWAAGHGRPGVWMLYVTPNVAANAGALGRHRVRAVAPGPAHRGSGLYIGSSG